jgi:sigma-B regulation protein RsbU (phosphoserine phosphatase)
MFQRSLQNLLPVPSLVLTLNECLAARSTANSFATAFVAVLDPGGALLYYNAGHTSALWIRGNGLASELTQGGPPLGIFAKSSYSEAAVQLAPGDLLVCFTDGISEAHNSQGESFGTERLLAWARGLQLREPAEVLRDLSTQVKRFCAGRVQEDDRSILVVRYRGE